MRREISNGFPFEVRLYLLEDATFGASKVLVMRISGNSLLNDGLEYGRLSDATFVCFLDPSLKAVSMYA